MMCNDRNSTIIDADHGKTTNSGYILKNTLKSSRLHFVKKVSEILTLKLVITTIWSLIFVYVDDIIIIMDCVKIATCAGTLTIGFLLVTFSANLFKREFWNYTLLMVFANFEGALVGLIVSYYVGKEAVIASITCILFSSILVFIACYTSVDFTESGASVYSFLLLLLAFRVILTFWPDGLLFILYCVLGGSVFSAYTIIGVQMVIGNGTNKFCKDHYMLIAITMYVIILNLYLFVLQAIHLL